ncbi:MAG: PIN domain-containing protein [Pseudonocardiaceae bacterium]
MSSDFVLDAGALVAAERAGRRWVVLWDHFVRFRVVPLLPAAVVGEVWRGGPRAARIARVLAASEVVDLTHRRARAAGELCGRAGTSNPIDASVVLVATPRQATVVTSDPDDIRQLADATGVDLPIIVL